MALRAKRTTFILNELFVKKRALEKSVHSKKRALEKVCARKSVPAKKCAREKACPRKSVHSKNRFLRHF